MTNPRRWILPALAVAALLWVAGCGQTPAPTEPDTVAAIAAPSSAGQSLFVLSSTAPQPAAKSGWDRWRSRDSDDEDASVTETVSRRRGGTLRLHVEGEERHSDVDVTLSVPRNGIPEGEYENDEVDITMTVTGEPLSQLVVAFAPSGLVFDQPARLRIKAEKGFVDINPDQIVIIHFTDDDGQPVEFEVKVDKKGTIVIDIEVRGFSRYSLPPGRGGR